MFAPLTAIYAHGPSLSLLKLLQFTTNGNSIIVNHFHLYLTGFYQKIFDLKQKF